MKTRYEYVVVSKKSGEILDKVYVRDDARYCKNVWKENGFDVKIVQRKYVLAEQREIR